ncbi:peptidyl-prolyl cis-trans isomerase [Cecembia sp.]|uniref:peptidyl-prolyl cis-trans isomerase n=1 Tax=Cecembia sp. TaxID=1898110 RepID=UPI0025B9BFE4|nr:peptidyl-prolyl cis-trans isomerase [Cecembia sp.]
MKKRKYTNLPLKIENSWILLLLLMASCDLFHFKSGLEDEEDPLVASVEQQFLRQSDLKLVNTTGLSSADSSNIIERYIQSWVRKQLMIKEASKSKLIDEAEINRKLLDYKYALMVYEFEKDYLEKNIENTIPEQEIEEYYNLNLENFSLKEIIARLNFLKLERNNPQNPNLERFLRLEDGLQKDAIQKIAMEQAANYYLEDAVWVKMGDIVINTPLAGNSNLVALLRNNKLIIVEDDWYRYYFRILEYRLEDQTPPLEFVKDEISKILLNKKRIQLVEELQKEIYNRALENNEFKIYE